MNKQKVVYFDMVEIIPGTGNAMFHMDFHIYMRFFEDGERIGVLKVGPEEDPANPGFCRKYPEVVQAAELGKWYGDDELCDIVRIPVNVTADSGLS